ncbi:tRNA uridine-5-carboxymethylaminomethyl(34) synthesis GTPase MnmE [Gracilinema caldarium]|uniref:tRNA modification GTPase MnmE n=1 Tax=Gracilinema caldarium (strain ATCC 51460 / DSM 7334 / H1) TaxID=744872 RepID=F8F0T7_GRAC1|nr:tRNA uridine-5-carboxymethylaminomethyl(34) synthesis GTPase MnmE [Gracilinema caldarium]AEJ20223.1 tRNA modification GTPase mnmE [Gracilinema caldarium DSM 7334]
MNRPSYGSNDPIAAHATPLAESALAVIRTAGPGCIDLLANLFSRPKALLSAPGNTIVHGWIQNSQGEKIDEVLLSVFRSPRSYTGEDAVDISCHGGIAIARSILQSLFDGGFRQALPGEFTFRAFMNGKLDLTRSESVVELIEAKTDESRRHALGRLSGVLETEIRAIKEALVHALAATELFLDYSEDDGVSGIAEDGLVLNDQSGTKLPAAIAEAAGIMPDRLRVEQALKDLEALAATYRIEKLYRDGALVAIAGRPNAGKSSLFNRLIKEERSIVTDIPGTTRDYIEAWISLEGIPVRLVDTAGLRQAEDPIEQIGVERSKSIVQAADLILFIIDGKTGFQDSDWHLLKEYQGRELWKDRQIPPILVIWNKSDIAPYHTIETAGFQQLSIAGVFTEFHSFPANPPILAVSAKTGFGIPELALAMRTILEGGPGSIISEGVNMSDAKSVSGHSSATPWAYPGKVSVGIASERQKALVDQAIASLKEALYLADHHAPLDLIAPELREAVESLGEITGEVTTAEILETMFSRFCVGK